MPFPLPIAPLALKSLYLHVLLSLWPSYPKSPTYPLTQCILRIVANTPFLPDLSPHQEYKLHEGKVSVLVDALLKESRRRNCKQQ